jgi:molybdenum cofactor biosynthesis protein MoaC
MAKLSHYGEKGDVRMVDVSQKAVTTRTAAAQGFVKMKPRVVSAVRRLKNPKGNPLEVARIAGIAAAKRTAEWIPLCHPLPLTHIDVTARLCQNGVEVRSTVLPQRPSQSTTCAKPSIKGWKSRTSFSPRRPGGRAGTSIGRRLRRGARDDHGIAQNGKAAAGG